MKQTFQLHVNISQETMIKIFVLLLLFLRFQPALANAADRLEVRDFTLKNGLRVLLLEDHRTPTITLQVWYKLGSRNEQFGKTGISHLLEHMMFRGSKKYGPDTFSKIVQQNGGHIDDLVIVPTLILLALKLVPKEVYQECKSRVMET